MGFENTKLAVKTYENRSMNFEQKKEAFIKPAIKAAMFPLQAKESVLSNFGIKVGAGQIINHVINNILEK